MCGEAAMCGEAVPQEPTATSATEADVEMEAEGAEGAEEAEIECVMPVERAAPLASPKATPD